MAASNQKSDLIQIVMLTFALCAVFFAGWGLFSNYKGNKLRTQRTVQLQRMKDLDKELRKTESKQVLKDDRRRKESEANSGQIDSAVASVLQSSNLRPATSNTDPPRSHDTGRRIEVALG